MKKSEQSIASKRRSGALTILAFLPPLDECGRHVDLKHDEKTTDIKGLRRDCSRGFAYN